MDARPTSVTVEVRQGETLHLGGLVTIDVLEKSGRTARLRVTAPKDVTVEKSPSGSYQACSNSRSEAPG